MAFTTFNEINRAFNNIAIAHKQISTYGIGDIWEIATSGDVRYPLMWAKPEDGRLETNIYVSNWSLIFMDLVDNGERNENDVLSDMELVALDVVALLSDPAYEFDFNYEGATIERFTERFEDKVSGVVLRIAIRIPYTADRCQVPQSGLVITGGGDLPCDPVAITDGITVVYVDAGGAYTCSSSSSGQCYDASAVLVNSSGSTISTTSIGSGGSANITAPDGTIIVNTTDGTVLGTKAVASNGNGVITLTDSVMYDSLGIEYNFPPPTGQITSYATGDDGYQFTNLWDAYWSTTRVGKRPQLTDFLTLLNNNIFGNTLRFTDSVGGTTYGAGNGSVTDYVIDHLTGLGWYRLYTTSVTWANAIAAAEASSQGGFSDWFIPNIQQQLSICDYSITRVINYSPFNLNIAQTRYPWTSTTQINDTTYAWALIDNDATVRFRGVIQPVVKTASTASACYLLCRKHF